MKTIFYIMFCIVTFSICGNGQCPKNSDGLYDRQKMLEKFEDILKDSTLPGAFSSIAGFFIMDLSQPSNQYASSNQYFAEMGNKSDNCINFIDHHIYHFSPIHYDLSQSHIGILQNGELKVFENINCDGNGNNLEKTLIQAKELLKNDPRRDEILTRVRNYRRYGHYRTVDGYRVTCNYDKELPENADKRYHRGKVLGQLSDMLRDSLSDKVKEQYSWWFSVEESRGVGFFVWDLMEPANKQTSLLERVEFKNDHVYHFAFIDLPFSFSNIVVLEDGKLKVFKAMNCDGKGDSLKDVVGYLNEKLAGYDNKDEVISRVQDYRRYGVYASFNGLTEPQCDEVVSSQR